MSSFRKFFKKESNDNSPSSAIAKLRSIEGMFAKKQEYCELKIKEELEVVKANASTNRRLALQALRRKKRLEQQLQQIDGTLTTIEMQREALEAASTNTAVLMTMKLATNTLKTAHKQMGVSSVHDIIDDVAEQQALAKEIAEACMSWGPTTSDLDEDDLLRELEELDQEELNKALLETGLPATTLPSLPTTSPPTSSRSVANEQTDEDMKKLKEWAS